MPPTKSKEETQAAIDELEREVGTDLIKSEAKQFNAVSVRSMAGLDEVGYADIDAYLASIGVDVTEATPELVAELAGDGFVQVKDKSLLLNIPMVLLTWQRDTGGKRIAKEDGSDGDGFLIVRAYTAVPVKVGGSDVQKVWFTCGGYGLNEELEQLSAIRRSQGSKTPNAGYKMPRGLKADALEDYPGKFIYRTNV